jgi:AcrR family transcriptional regulator
MYTYRFCYCAQASHIQGRSFHAAPNATNDDIVTVSRSTGRKTPLPPRDPRGGRPTHDIAARLGEHILEVALAQFVVSGVEETGMDDIAAAANVSKRTLYARYGSKMDLLIAAMKHGIDHHLKPIVATMRSGCPRERLLRTVRKMLDLSLKPEIIGLERLAYWVRDQKINDVDLMKVLGINPGITLIQTLLQEAAEPGEADLLDLPFLAAFIFDALVTTPRQRILVREDMPDTPQAKSEYLEQAIDMFARILPVLNRQDMPLGDDR